MGRAKECDQHDRVGLGLQGMFGLFGQVHQIVVTHFMPCALGLHVNAALQAMQGERAGHGVPGNDFTGLQHQAHDLDARGADNCLGDVIRRLGGRQQIDYFSRCGVLQGHDRLSPLADEPSR